MSIFFRQLIHRLTNITIYFDPCHVTLPLFISGGIRSARCSQCGCHNVATLQAGLVTQANWQWQYNQPAEGQSLETFPLPWTSQAGSRWLDVTWQVDNTTGDSWTLCPAGLLGSVESPVQSQLNLARHFPSCLLCHCPLLLREGEDWARHATAGIWTVGLHHFCVPSQPISNKHDSTDNVSDYSFITARELEYDIAILLASVFFSVHLN